MKRILLSMGVILLVVACGQKQERVLVTYEVEGRKNEVTIDALKPFWRELRGYSAIFLSSEKLESFILDRYLLPLLREKEILESGWTNQPDVREKIQNEVVRYRLYLLARGGEQKLKKDFSKRRVWKVMDAFAMYIEGIEEEKADTLRKICAELKDKEAISQWWEEQREVKESELMMKNLVLVEEVERQKRKIKKSEWEIVPVCDGWMAVFVLSPVVKMTSREVSERGWMDRFLDSFLRAVVERDSEFLFSVRGGKIWIQGKPLVVSEIPETENVIRVRERKYSWKDVQLIWKAFSPSEKEISVERFAKVMPFVRRFLVMVWYGKKYGGNSSQYQKQVKSHMEDYIRRMVLGEYWKRFSQTGGKEKEVEERMRLLQKYKVNFVQEGMKTLRKELQKDIKGK